MKLGKKAEKQLKEGMSGDAGDEVPGIVILDGGQGVRAALTLPRVRAFVYGERIPAAPTLPFGRWKAAS